MKKQHKSWYRVRAPYGWRPKPGDELVGEFLGTQVRFGQFGEYKIHLVKTRGRKIQYVSGTVTNDMFAMVRPGQKIKLVFVGMQQVFDTERIYKKFELYTEEEIEFNVISSTG